MNVSSNIFLINFRGLIILIFSLKNGKNNDYKQILNFALLYYIFFSIKTIKC